MFADNKVIRPLVACRVVNTALGFSRVVYALLDQGSDRDVISPSLIKDLRLDTWTEYMTVKTLDHSVRAERALTSVRIESVDQFYRADVRGALVGSRLIGNDVPPAKRDVSAWSHISDLSFEDYDASLELIIGVPHAETWLGTEIRRGPSNQPIAFNTAFGWTIIGTCGKSRTSSIACNALSEDNERLHQQIDRLFYHDFAIVTDSEMGLSQENRLTIKLLQESIRFDEVKKKYRVALPWKYGREKSADILRSVDSKSMSMKRLMTMVPRLLKDEKRRKEIFATVEKWESKGVSATIDDVAENRKAIRENRPVWHLPLLCVDEPTKIRVCHDAKASTRGIGLNDLLMGGPNLTNNLAAVLLLFRQFKYAFSTDIAGFFHQVLLDERDIDTFRFLWFTDENMRDVTVRRFLSHVFGSGASSCITTFTTRHLAERIKALFPMNVYTTMRKNLYVDDAHGGGDTIDETVRLKENLIEAMALGGFSLSKWKANHPALLPHEEGQPAPVVEDKLEKILGVWWNPKEDVFRFYLDMATIKLPAKTPRQLVSVSCSLFDPNGFFSPFILRGRQMLQKAQQQNGRKGWDNPLSSELAKEFMIWASSIPLLQNYPVTRWWETDATMNASNVQWHFFADASKTGYGAVVYRRAVAASGEISLAIVMSRSHVVPLDSSKASHHGLITNLELTSNASQIECLIFVLKAIGPIAKKYHWTDSECCLKWIKDMTTVFPEFVANRLSKIHEVSKAEEWRHVPSQMNPADMCARGLGADEKEKWSEFHRGPEFLYKPESEWPKVKSYFLPKPFPVATCAAIVAQPQAETYLYDTCVKKELWSDMLRVVARVRKVSVFWRRKCELVRPITKATAEALTFSPLLTFDELWKAELSLFGLVQRRCFQREQDELLEKEVNEPESRKELAWKQSPLKALSPFIGGDGLIRVGSRILRANAKEDAKTPIILPRHDHVVRAYIRFIHKQEAHAGPKHVLSQLRQKVWIIHGGQEVRSIVTKCVVCQKAFKKPLEQKMAVLPEMRVTPNPPFKEVGLDLMGPFGVKYPGSRATHKVWGVVFACMSSRSVHVEIVQSMDAPSLMNAIACFSARRPGTTHFVSDNGGNLTRANKDLKKHLREWNTSSAEHLQRQGVHWTFIPPRAPHRGGSWERVVGLFKRHLATFAVQDPINIKIFETALISIEGILNRRPLTALSPQADDCEALTPAHVLYPAMEDRRSSVVVSEDPFDTTSLRNKFAVAQSRVNGFWKAWSKDYLQLLHTRQKWRITKEDLKVGDLVICRDNPMARGDWRLCRVHEVVKDGQHVRQVKIRTGEGKLLWRDRTKLVLLELDDEGKQDL